MNSPISAKARESKEPKVVSHFEVRKADNGGYIVEKHFTSYEHKPERNVFGKDEGSKALDHIADGCGIKD